MSRTSHSTQAPELSVIAPCLNEALNVPELARRVLGAFDRGGLRGELVLVDDGSTDATPELLRTLAATHPGRVMPCFHPTNRGIEQAWRTGIEAARASVVAVIDSDLQYQPEDLLRLYRELVGSGVDVVQGYRSQIGRTRGKRYHLSRGFNVLLNGTFGMQLRDNKSGFVMCEREVFLDLLSHRARYHYWQSFVMVAAHAKGYSYKEVETLFEDRKAGASFLDAIAYRASARSLVDLAKGFVEYRLRSAPGDVADRFVDHAPPPPTRPSLVRRLAFGAYAATLDETRRGVTRDVARRKAVLDRTQWLSRAELDALQNEKLRRLVRHAYREVPFYRERLRAAGLRAEDVRTRADLGKVPLLTRGDIEANLYFDLLSQNHDKGAIRKGSSVGRSGAITTFFVDRPQLEVRFAARARAREWSDFTFGDPLLVLASDAGGASTSDRLLGRETRLQIGAVDDRAARRVADALHRTRSTLLEGDAELLTLVAARVGQATPKRTGSLRAIVSSGQTLDATARGQIERAFGAPVFDRYTTGELGCVAQECAAHDGLHVNEEGLVVELLVGDRPAKPGEVGRVVVTDLTNYCMPLLRYDTGDLAIAVDRDMACACGRALARIAALQGKPMKTLRGEGGLRVPSSHLTEVVRRFDHAFSGAVISTTEDGRVHLALTRGGRFSDEALAQVLEACAALLGNTPIDVALCDPPPEAQQRLDIPRRSLH